VRLTRRRGQLLDVRGQGLLPVGGPRSAAGSQADGRELLLARAISEPATDDAAAARAAALTAEIAKLQQRQDNLVRELEGFEPSGDDDFDQAWRSGIRA
jgi:hypothetical protein